MRLIFFLFYLTILFSQSKIDVVSPNEKLKITASVKDEIVLSVFLNNKVVLEEIKLSKYVNNFRNLGKFTTLLNHELSYRTSKIRPIVPVKSSLIDDTYNQLILYFKDKFNIHIRVYNDGFAYRFETLMDKTIEVNSETMDIKLPVSTLTYFHQEEKLYSHYERDYKKGFLSEFKSGDFASLPNYLRTENNVHIVISEADLFDYPNMFLEISGDGLKSKFPMSPL